ncbi:hypothetical protein ACIQM4_26440 [Streptomyces sp. NPDC091272]|uniref:hypothetical protein n=1 Tax=Streptomyces sp. NPDC091272 TaxID=3365981 RepID=UPI0038106704
MTAQNTNAKSTAAAAKATAASATDQAKDAGSKAKDAGGTVKEATGKAGAAAQTATAAGLKGVQAGKQALESASGKVVSTATTAWTLFQNRKAVVAGAGAGVVAIGAVSYAVGRKVEQHSHGPLTKLLAGTKL